MGLKYKVVVPSMGRAAVFARSLAPRMGYPQTFVVVFTEEAEEYRYELDLNHVPHVKVVGIPNTIIGKAGKLQWCVENLYEPDDDMIVFMDDDIKGLRWMMSKKLEHIEDTAVPAILDEEYYLAREFGTRLLCLSYNAGILGIKRNKPIAINEALQGVMYLQLSRDVKYDSNVRPCEDTDVTLMELFSNGVIVADRRYAVDSILKLGEGEGGMSVHRNTESLQRMRQYLLQKYGYFAMKYIKKAI